MALSKCLAQRRDSVNECFLDSSLTGEAFLLMKCCFLHSCYRFGDFICFKQLYSS